MNMKPNLLRACALAFLLALPGLVPHARAQAVAGAPAYVDYQGRTYKSTGEPLGTIGNYPGPYTPQATNYTMQFRIYGSQSGNDLIWAETQTVTVQSGDFSVRLGSGAAITSPTTLPHGSLATAFNGKDRYLELTVIFPGNTTGTPILPRLAFQSSPFSLVAERAKRADSVGSDTAGEIVGKVTAAGGSTFTGALGSPITLSGPVTSTGATFSGGTFLGNGAGLTNLSGAALTAGSVSAEKLGADVGLWTVNGADVSRPGGNVWIGGTNSAFGVNAPPEYMSFTTLTVKARPLDALAMLLFDQNGINVFSIGTDGNTYATSLSAEEIHAAGRRVVTSVQQLSILRGNVSSDGTIEDGYGFTVIASGGGTYTITFDTPFTSRPTVTGNCQAPQYDNKLGIISQAAGSVVVRTMNSGGAVGENAPFTFIAVGER